MNCLEFRRACQADPEGLSAGARAHLQACPACARFAAAQRDLDRRLVSAMRVSPPEGLAARVVFERSLRGRRRMRWLSVAAAALIAVAAALAVYVRTPAPMAPGEFVAHLRIDPMHELPADPDARAELARVTGDLGLAWREAESMPVLRAKLCDVDGHKGAHLVLAAGDARATAFVMPGMTAAEAGRLAPAGMAAMIVQTPEGVIAVFCPEQAMLATVGERVRRAVAWDAA